MNRKPGPEATRQWRELWSLIAQGDPHFPHDVYFTFDRNANEPCLVDTNRTPSQRTLNEYRKRFGCEPFFFDLKSRGAGTIPLASS